MQNREDKFAVVTGANRGIGLEVVLQLARLGVIVILGSRDLGKGEQAAAPMITEGLKVIPRQLDVAVMGEN
jgi:NAD(P)-dependent dehydrogenase (short-subunit alcohol dehydrogenase family)